MKTILFVLFLTCCDLWAQTYPVATNTTNSADQQAAVRDALRAAEAAKAGNAASPPPMVPTLRPIQRPLGARPSGTNTPLPGPLGAPAQAPVGINPPGIPGATTVQAPPATPPPGVPGGLPVIPGGVLTPPGPAAPPEQIIGAGEIDFRAASLEEVLKIYAQLVNRTLLRAQLPPVLINLTTQTPLTKSEAIQALESIMAMNQITVVPQGDKFVKVVPAQLVTTIGAQFSTNDISQLPESDTFITKIVNLKYLKTSDIMPAIQPLAQLPNSIIPIESSSMLIIRDYASNVKRMVEMINKLDVVVPLEWDSEVIPIRYADAEDISSALSSIGGTTAGSIGTSSRGSSGGGASRAGGAGFGGSALGGGSGYGGTGINQGGIGGLGGSNPTGIGGAAGARSSSLSDRIGKIINNASKQGDFNILGNTKIIADKRTNSLLVFADKADMAMIKKIVAELDVVLPQVLIEAIIMEVTLDNTHSFGVSYLQKNASTPGNYFTGIGAVNNGTFLSPNNFLANGTNGQPNVPSGLSYLANFGGDFDATVTAIAGDSHINVLSRPRIQTSHGVEATLQVGQQVPIVSGTYFGGINGQASSQYQEQFVGISLDVKPLINQEGLVVMEINANVQQLGPNYTIDGNPVPSTTQRSAQSTVSVRDHDTIILGGMIQNSRNISNSGVPLLKDIPGLGYLFRSSNSDVQRTELIVLIRPTVLPTPEAAAMVATHERAKMPGIKNAEMEERIDANRRTRQADKIQIPKEQE